MIGMCVCQEMKEWFGSKGVKFRESVYANGIG